MVPFGFKNSWHVWFHIFCGIEILELNGIDVDVETYIDLFYSFLIYNLQYQTGMKCGTLCWSNLKIAERGENFSQRQKSSGKKTDDASVQRKIMENQGLYKINKWIKLIFILQTLVSLQNAFFSETIFKGFVNQFLMPLYSRWISMIWIL